MPITNRTYGILITYIKIYTWEIIYNTLMLIDSDFTATVNKTLNFSSKEWWYTNNIFVLCRRHIRYYFNRLYYIWDTLLSPDENNNFIKPKKTIQQNTALEKYRILLTIRSPYSCVTAVLLYVHLSSVTRQPVTNTLLVATHYIKSYNNMCCRYIISLYFTSNINN